MRLDFLLALVGGAFIGLASLMMLFFNGRILGVSGILGGIFQNKPRERSWRWTFVAGVLTGGMLLRFVLRYPFEHQLDRPIWIVCLAGLLVGFGTRLGGGCTSGHGVCGISRLSLRSILATIVFMAMGVVTVYLTGKMWPL